MPDDANAPPRFDPELAEAAAWADLPELPRPSLERPAGIEGGLSSAAPARLGEGGHIAGVLSPESTSRHFLLDAPAEQDAHIEIYARCLREPCQGEFAMRSFHGSRRGSARGWSLHRAAPRWHRRRARLHVGDDHLLVLDCGDECAETGAVEFYGVVRYRPAEN